MRRARLFSRRQPLGSHNLAEDPAVFATEPRMLPFFPRKDANSKQTSDLFSLFQDTLLWKRGLFAKASTSKPQTISIPEHTPRWPTSSIVRRDRSPPWSPSHWLSSYGMQLDKRVDLPAPTKPPVNAQRQTTSLVNLLEEVSYLANSPEDDDNVLRRAPSSLSRQ